MYEVSGFYVKKETHENWVSQINTWKLKLNEKLAKYGFDTLEFFRKPILLHDLENFLTWFQDRCSSLSAYISILNNQNVTSIEIRKKLEDLGEKMKTHVSKISSRSRARI